MNLGLGLVVLVLGTGHPSAGEAKQRAAEAQPLKDLPDGWTYLRREGVDTWPGGGAESMTTARLAKLRWPFHMRSVHITLGGVSHALGQLFYLGMECAASAFGRRAFRDEQRAVRRSAHLYWIAERLDRRGESEKALHVAKEAFAALTGAANQRKTFLQMGYATAILVADLADHLGQPDAARSELREALRIFKEIRSAASNESSLLDDVVATLEHRVNSRSAGTAT